MLSILNAAHLDDDSSKGAEFVRVVEQSRAVQAMQKVKKSTVTGMFGWILKTDWDIGRVMKLYARKGASSGFRHACKRS